jgi:hypothetical protein
MHDQPELLPGMERLDPWPDPPPRPRRIPLKKRELSRSLMFAEGGLSPEFETRECACVSERMYMYIYIYIYIYIYWELIRS